MQGVAHMLPEAFQLCSSHAVCLGKHWEYRHLLHILKLITAIETVLYCACPFCQDALHTLTDWPSLLDPTIGKGTQHDDAIFSRSRRHSKQQGGTQAPSEGVQSIHGKAAQMHGHRRRSPPAGSALP